VTLKTFEKVDEKLNIDTNTVLAGTLHSAEKQARAVLESENVIAKWYVLFGTIVMPLLWSAHFSLWKFSEHKILFPIISLVLGGLTGFFVLKIMRLQAPQNAHFVLTDLYRTAHELRTFSESILHQNEDMRKKIERLDASVEALAFGLSESTRQLNATLASPPPATHAEFKTSLTSILESLSSDFAALYGLAGNKVMFTVYLWDKRDERLKISFRKVKGNIKEKGRSWGRRDGFAGVVFAEKKTNIDNEIGVADGATSSFKIQDIDKESYRSAIGVPVIGAGDEYSTEIDPIGVLVLTSNIANAFNDTIGPDNRYSFILDAIAQILAVYLDFVAEDVDDPQYSKVVFGE
jgi:hypothetical protein